MVKTSRACVQETLFILKWASAFGTEAREVYQVIEPGQYLQNVILLGPQGSFIVNSSVTSSGSQRSEFQFESATFKVNDRALKLPPWGRGWCGVSPADSTRSLAAPPPASAARDLA